MLSNTLTSLLLKTTHLQLTNDKKFTPTDAYTGLTAYRDYFAHRIAGKDTPEVAFNPATDRFLEELEQKIADREELEIDAVMIGKKYPTLDHFYEEAFQMVIDLADELAPKQSRFFTKSLPEIALDIGQYDRKWLRQALGIRTTPNPVREENDVLTERLDEVDQLDFEAYEALLLKLIRQYPDNPLLATSLVLMADQDDLAEVAQKHLRPITNYPAGKLGFYQDTEVTENWLAHCRVLLETGQDLEVLPYAENLLRLGHFGSRLDDIILLLLDGPLRLTKALRKRFPLVSTRINELSASESGDFMEQLLSMIGPAKGEVDPDDFFKMLSNAIGGNQESSAVLKKPPLRLSTDAIIRIKITLKNSKPPIWRRLELRADTPLEELHAIIQTIFEWDNSHLHAFQNSRRDSFVSPGDPYSLDWSESYEGMTTMDMFSLSGKKFTYHYDFGDSWYHDVVLEKELPPDPKAAYPRCTAGRRAAPLDDMGGLWGFYEYVEAVKDSKHEMHEDAIEWLGEDFDAAAFDLGAIDHRLAIFR